MFTKHQIFKGRATKTHGAFADKAETPLIVIDPYQGMRIHKLVYVASGLWSHFYKHPS